jgi:malonate-semialdehyde dehydrogenase (acetylating)/methylmalonate-semialdehyde dehydrogenase
MVQGDRQAVDGLLAHTDTAANSFVESIAFGRSVQQRGSAGDKRVHALG